jgi:diaminopimelate decarboxylase
LNCRHLDELPDMNHFELIDGVLHAEQVPLPELAAAVGTPLYVYSSATIIRHAQAFLAAVAPLTSPAGEAPLVAFAVKANSNLAVLATLARLGLGADVVSGGELQRALAAGVDPAKIVFSGVGKTAAELRLGLAAGIGQFNLESEAEAILLDQVARALGRVAPIAFRINPDVDAGTHAKISTGKSDNKFGVSYHAAPAAYAQAAALPGLKVQGVAVHIGSQLTKLAPLEAAFKRVGELLKTLRAAGHQISLADLGGGLGIPYNPAEPAPPSPADYGAMIALVVKGWDVRFMFEPGRLIVGNAGILLSKVIRIKQGNGAPFVIVDAAMNDLLRPSLYDAWHEIRAVKPNGVQILANIVGPVCESSDSFAANRMIDAVDEGALVAFMTAGAYGATMASSYNSRAIVPEVLVNGSASAIVRRRVEVAELIAQDEQPAWLTR